MQASHTQPQQAAVASPAEATAFRPTHKPKLTMIWVSETIGDRIRLVARWTTQD